MQTFLLHTDHHITAKLLDYKRLGKQRLECTQLMDVLLRKANLLQDGKTGWNNHVAVEYWYTAIKNCLPYLILYTDIMIEEWINRGYKNTIDTTKYKEIISKNANLFRFDESIWRTYENDVIVSHRARVLQKDFDYYSKIFKENNISIPENWENMEYFWMRPTEKQIKELKQGKLIKQGIQLYRTGELVK